MAHLRVWPAGANIDGDRWTGAWMASGDDIASLVSRLGGNSSVLGLYDVRHGITTSSGNVTQWNDVRGASGYGPALTPTDATGPALTGTDASSWLINLAASRALQTAATSLFDLSTAKSAFVVSTFQGTTQGGTMSIGDDAASHYLDIEPTSAAGYIELQGIANGTAVHVNPPDGQQRDYHSKLRVTAMAISGSTIYLRTPPWATDQTVAIGAMAANTPRLLVGKVGGVYATDTARAVIVLNRLYTSADVQAVAAWARASHAAVTGSSHLYVFEGDSITSGAGLSNSSQSWATVTQQLSYYLKYDDLKVSTSGSQLTDVGSPPQDITARASTRVDPYYDGSRARNILVCFAGTNDIAVEGQSGATAASRLWTYCDARKAVGWKVVVATPLGRKFASSVGVITSQAALDTELANYRTAIHGNYATHADALIDFYADTRLQDYTNLTYFQSDGIHPTASGHSVMSGIADPVLQGLG